MSGARAVLFDLGGVLLPFDRERRIAAIVQRTGADEGAVRAFMASDLHRRLDAGDADERDLADGLTALAGREVGQGEACALILSVFEAPNADLWRLAHDLGERMIVGGFSDNPGFVRRAFPNGAVLDPLFLSCEIGACKPTPRAFRAVQDRLALPPAAILFIDDMPANIEQARRQGWDGVVFQSNAQLRRELSARGLT